ncbi:MAG: hypothetical protein QOE46_1624 [Acidobacteriota bacterium]|jgi:hypothetical protein|nr:hypothetical protein [Acidobacteriota bacterium]
MAKVFLRSFYPYPTRAVVAPRQKKQTVSCAEEWRKFEELLKACLGELGHEVIEQQAHPETPDRLHDARFKIYAHKTRRDAQGDLFYKQMHLPELLTIDRHGWGAEHSGMQTPPDLSGISCARAADFVASLRANYLEAGISKHPQPARGLARALPDDYIFIPTQTPRDYVQLHHAPITVLNFIRLLARWAGERKQHVVFKLHPGLRPSSDDEIIRAVHECVGPGGYVHCVEANIHDLIAGARGVFTINSGVGFESLIHGKPVATFGNCDYKWVTFHAHAGNLDEARAFVRDYSDEQKCRAEAFLFHYFFQHAYSVAGEHVASSRQRLRDYLARELAP